MNRMLRSLSAAALSLTLTAPALAAGMSSFSPSVTYTPFPDVADSAWYAPYVRQAVELGLIDRVGTLSDALECLYEQIGKTRQQ